MKNTPSLPRTGLQHAALLIGLGLCYSLAAAATFTVTPSAVSNTYTGTITLQIGGLTNGETVVVQEFMDLNANGVIEASDWLARQFQLTDGLSTTIGGIVNSNVPADTTATNGTITARQSFQHNHVQSFIGKYLFRLSSPAGRFNPITRSFTVTNLPYVPGFKGTVKCGGTNVPNALVLLFKGPIFNSNLQAGTVADNSGNYLIKALPGTYELVALKNNYLPNTLTAPVLTLGSTTLTTNLSLVAATSTIAGTMVDAANPGLTLPGMLVSANGPNNSMAISFTDANGNFTLAVTSGQWRVSGDDVSLIAAGYVKSQNPITATAGRTGLTLAEPKANGLFYGTVKDGSGKPIPGVDVYARDNNDYYETDGYSDAKGNYFVAVLGGLNSDPWHMFISNDSSPANYVYPEVPFEQYGGTNLTVGQTVRADFVALLATNQISGYLKDSANHPISNVWIWASATINNASYGRGIYTDANGHYAINICSGTWWVGVSCGGGGAILDSQYLCPNSQMVTIANKNTNVNFTALLPPSQISGTVKDNRNNPIANVGVYAYLPSVGGNGVGATTDGNGHYSFNVVNGDWYVNPSCCGNQGLSPLGYVCVGVQSTTVSNSSSVVNFSVPHAPYQITGHLRDTSNNPITNVNVSAYSDSYSACATTADDGSYTLSVTNGDWHIYPDCWYLNSLGYLCPNDQSVTVSNANVVLDLSVPQAPYTITGWVRNSNNQPFTNLDVQASATIGADNYRSDSLTDANGNFSIQVANGQWNVGVDCGRLGNSYRCPDSQTVTIANDSGTANFTALLPPSQISGTVKDNSNNPIANVWVYAYMPSGVGYGAGATTDGNGHYSLNVANGDWNVYPSCCGNQGLSPLGYVCVGVQSTTVSNSSSVVNFSVPHAPYQITGRLRDTSNNPITNVSVSAYSDSYSACATTTAGDGSYTLYVTNGDWHIYLDCGYLIPLGYLCPNDQSVTVSNAIVVLDLSVPQAAYTITGWVRNSNNQPFTNLDVQASGTIGTNYYQSDALTDANGNYSLPVVNGQWNVGVDCGRLGNSYLCPDSQTVTIADNSGTANFTALLPPSQISGTVKDSSNNPIVNVWVYAYMPSGGGYGASATTDDNGHYSFNVVNGDWFVYPSCCGNQGLSPLSYVCVEGQSTTVSNSSSVVNFSVPHAPYQITGHLRDTSNNPITNVSVSAYGNSYSACATTAADGSYTLYVTNGDWHIYVNCGYLIPLGYLCPNDQSVTVSNANVVLDLSVPQATYTITGWVRNSNNQPFTNLDVQASGTIGTNYYQSDALTDANGNYSLPVVNGQWNVGVDCGRLGESYLCPDSQTVTIANNSGTANFTALLPPSQISGTVNDNSNNPIANVWVYAYMPSGGGYGASATTDGNGHYSFNVVNGDWFVYPPCCGNQGLSPLGYVCVGGQSTTVSNSSSVVNFSVPHAPYQITGHLRDTSNNPITNVSVIAYGNSYSACAITAGDGSYTLYVTNGNWYISLDRWYLNSLGYLYPNDQSVTVSNANVVLDLSVPQAPHTITGWVRNSNNQPFTNLDVQASATIGTNHYQSDALTDANGNFSIRVDNGQWNVGVDCGGLGNGYLCPDEVSVVIAGASVVTNFTIQPCGQLQILTTSLPGGQAGSYYDFYLQATSCYPNFYWVLFGPPSSLPPGLQLDSTGQLYGTPISNGTFNFTVQVADGNYVTATQPLSLTISPVLADAVEYSVMKMDCFRQLDAINLVPDTNNGPFAARLEIIQSGLGAVPIANVGLPSAGLRAFPPGNSGIELAISESYPSQGAFDAVYSNGNYTFSMATVNNGFQYPVLTMPVAVYPAAPRVSNFTAAQAINPANPFTLRWSNPSDATTNDVIWVRITDSTGNIVFRTPYPATNRSTCLRGTATSVVVPAGTLPLGSACTGVIGFYRMTGVNMTSYPGAVGITLVAAETAFPLAAPSSLPVLSQPTRISATQFGFLLSGAAGTNYTVLASTNATLPLSNWSQVLTTNLPGSSAFIQDNQATTQQRYYRVKVGP